MVPQGFIEAVKALPFSTRVELARAIGIEAACCSGCGCWIGSPNCGDAAADPFRPELRECVCSDNPDNQDDAE